MDTISPEQRSRVMKAVGKRDTAPELVVRRALHRMGYRYRLHGKGLPGTPDIVFKKRKKAIFVHGCFWHGHACRRSLTPKSRTDYWQPKIARNVERDLENERRLKTDGWGVLSVWECRTRPAHLEELDFSLRKFLGPTSSVRK